MFQMTLKIVFQLGVQLNADKLSTPYIHVHVDDYNNVIQHPTPTAVLAIAPDKPKTVW